MEKLKIDLVVNSNASIEDQMYQAYENCPAAIKYCHELGIPEEVIRDNIGKVFDFVSDINYCKNCPGVNKCQKNNPLLVTKVTYKNGMFDSTICPCKQLLKKVTFERQFITADFEQSWLDSTLKDIDTSKERTEALEKYANFIRTGKANWIYLTGGPNSGRSFMAACMVVDAAKREKGPICYLNCSTRINEMKEIAYKKNEDFQTLLNQYASVPILVLDDFGNEFKNDFIRDAIVFQLLSLRANKKLFTILTSDFTIDEIETLYTTSKAGEIRAKQIGRIIRSAAEKEINLGDLAIY